MFSKRHVSIFISIAVFALLVLNNVLADDGRINHAPYHFGGDTLFCSQAVGCTLLDKNGKELATWSPDAIGTAIALTDSTGINTQVSGDAQGSYGPMQLWVVSPDATTGNNTLCMIGFDEWGKKNDMCFPVTKDYHFEPAPLPVSGDQNQESELPAEPTSEVTPIVTPEITPIVTPEITPIVTPEETPFT